MDPSRISPHFVISDIELQNINKRNVNAILTVELILRQLWALYNVTLFFFIILFAHNIILNIFMHIILNRHKAF